MRQETADTRERLQQEIHGGKELQETGNKAATRDGDRERKSINIRDRERDRERDRQRDRERERYRGDSNKR